MHKFVVVLSGKCRDRRHACSCNNCPTTTILLQRVGCSEHEPGYRFVLDRPEVVDAESDEHQPRQQQLCHELSLVSENEQNRYYSLRERRAAISNLHQQSRVYVLRMCVCAYVFVCVSRSITVGRANGKDVTEHN